MPGGLPPGLITNTETITEEIDKTERVQVEDVAKLWRVYSLNSSHMEDDEASRLENFFWRIWSNRNIITSIRGNTLARLFITISEGGNRVRTTPVPTPLATTPTQGATSSSAAAPRFGRTQVSLEKSGQPIASASTVDSGASPRRISDQTPTLPPILKKSRTGSDDPPKPAQIPSPDTGKRGPRVAAERRESSDSARALSPQAGPAEKGLKNAGKKKTSFASAAGNRKSRPGVTRKRSSQTSTSNEPRKGSQTSPSPRLQPGKATPKSALGLPPVQTPATFALPSSSWQDVDSPSSRTSLDNAFSTPQQPSSWLVDKNFRGKFVENQHRATSSINLAALGKSQSVRFLDEMPEHQKLAGKGKARAQEGGPERVAIVGRPPRSPPQATSSAIEDDDDDDGEDDDDDDDMPPLPRTKSQLSVLIDKERKYSGSTNLGPEKPRRAAGPGKDDKDTNDDEEEEENELLTMARRDKKGKPGDPDRPFKAAAKKGLWRGGMSGDDGGDGSKSPPAMF